MMSSAGTLDSLAERLARATLVHVDARVLARHLTSTGSATQTDTVLAGIRDGHINAQTSSLSLYQILVEAYRQGEADLAQDTARSLRLHARLELVPAGPEIAVQAAEVRARLGGRPERALQIATALVSGAEIYLTSESGLRRVAGMQVLNVEDYAPDGVRSATAANASARAARVP